jgi:hypothetical protein
VAQSPDSTAKVQISGYVTASYFYASNPDSERITGRLYDRFHDQFQISAARVTVQKPVAADRREAGFQLDLMVGPDAPQIRAAGLSLGEHADLPQAFVTLNLPTGPGRYVRFAAGKRWTMMDVEYVDDVLNPNYSQGYQYIYLSNFTDVGLSVEAKLSSAVVADVRLINGWDVALDNNKGKSVVGRLAITPSDQVSLSFLGGLGPEQDDNTSNNRYYGQFVGMLKPAQKATLYGQFDAGNEEGLGVNDESVSWWSAGAWGVFDVSPKASVAVRGEYLDDADGVRTSGVLGFPAAPSRKLQSLTATLNIKSWEHALVRPEVRLEHSSNHDFRKGARANQASFGVALSYVF